MKKLTRTAWLVVLTLFAKAIHPFCNDEQANELTDAVERCWRWN
jgi:hypothetical protein